MKRIAIFASGGGSNALKFLEYFDEVSDVEVALIVTNKKNAGVLQHAKEYDIPTLVIDRGYFYKSKCILEVLATEHIDLIVLAGFLWLIPPYLIQHYPNKIVNIHPALLPKYGGQGMYGEFVHKAVHAAKEKESGITIHYVNEAYDEGKHIFQATCTLHPTDEPDRIAKKVLALEHANFPRVIHKLLSDK